MVSIQLVPILADVVGWQYALLVLAPAPAMGAAAMHAFGARQPVPLEEPG